MRDVLGHFEQAVLIALIRLGKEAYGRAILNETQRRLERHVSAGAVYATLERLETKGLASLKLVAGTFGAAVVTQIGVHEQALTTPDPRGPARTPSEPPTDWICPRDGFRSHAGQRRRPQPEPPTTSNSRGTPNCSVFWPGGAR